LVEQGVEAVLALEEETAELGPQAEEFLLFLAEALLVIPAAEEAPEEVGNG
jgi:hypothetical protein